MVGISTREVHNGIVELRQTSDVLGDMARQFQAGAISAEQMSIILENLAGQRQADVLAAMIQNWHLYEEAMKNFEEGQGSAAREAQRTA